MSFEHRTTPHRASAPPASKGEWISIRTEDLVVGRCLLHGLYDAERVLLLAANSEITPQFRQRLEMRGIDRVCVSAADEASLANAAALVEPATTEPAATESTTAESATAVLRTNEPATMESATTEPTTAEPGASAPMTTEAQAALLAPLDELIDSGALFVANTGRAVADRIVARPRDAYDFEERKALLAEHDGNIATLRWIMDAIEAGASYDAHRLQTMAEGYITRLVRDPDSVVSLATVAGDDPDILRHCTKSAILGMAIGVELGLDERNLRALGLCGLVHDWGMLRVPTAIREADRVLSPVEFLEIQKHVVHSLEMLQSISGLPTVVPLVSYQVHEQENGRGYPRGRRGSSIHMFARILKVADVFVGMTERRPYRPPFSAYSAMECLVRLAREKAVDPHAVRALLQKISLFPIGSQVALDDGRLASVLRRNGDHYTQPIVRILENADGSEPVAETIVDLAESECSVARAMATAGTDEMMIDPDRILVDRR